MLTNYHLNSFILSIALTLVSQNLAWATPQCSDLFGVGRFGENTQTLLSPDSTEGAKNALAMYFKDDPQNSVEKNWKRVRKWKENNKIYRSFRSNSGLEVLVIYDVETKTNSVSTQHSQVENAQNTGNLTSAKPKKLPPRRLLFAIDKVGMSADDSGYLSVVIISRKLFEEEMWVPDHMERSDRQLLRPLLEYVGLKENMSNEFQMTSEIKDVELIRLLTELGLVYDKELQSVVDEMGAM